MRITRRFPGNGKVLMYSRGGYTANINVVTPVKLENLLTFVLLIINKWSDSWFGVWLLFVITSAGISSERRDYGLLTSSGFLCTFDSRPGYSGSI